MSVSFYMDEHIPGAMTARLRHLGIDVLTVQEDDRTSVADPLILDRATELGRVLFTCDEDFLIETARRQREGRYFAGVMYAHQSSLPLRQITDDLALFGIAADREDVENLIVYLPLRLES